MTCYLALRSGYGSYGPGGYPPIINAGDVSNKGFEFEMAYATDPNKD